jgi:hypothetical protein
MTSGVKEATPMPHMLVQVLNGVKPGHGSEGRKTHSNIDAILQPSLPPIKVTICQRPSPSFSRIFCAASRIAQMAPRALRTKKNNVPGEQQEHLTLLQFSNRG